MQARWASEGELARSSGEDEQLHLDCGGCVCVLSSVCHHRSKPMRGCGLVFLFRTKSGSSRQRTGHLAGCTIALFKEDGNEKKKKIPHYQTVSHIYRALLFILHSPLKTKKTFLHSTSAKLKDISSIISCHLHYCLFLTPLPSLKNNKYVPLSFAYDLSCASAVDAITFCDTFRLRNLAHRQDDCNPLQSITRLVYTPNLGHSLCSLVFLLVSSSIHDPCHRQPLGGHTLCTPIPVLSIYPTKSPCGKQSNETPPDTNTTHRPAQETIIRRFS